MKYILNKKPANTTIIQGFPSFGLVSTIATGFLIDHLDAIPIGEIILEDSPPMLAIHNKKIIKPVEIYYSKKNNLVIINALANVAGKEWELSETILSLANDLKSKELLILEGIATQEVIKDPKSYYYCTKENKKLKSSGLTELNEGVIIGMPASIISKAKTMNISCIFTETNAALPDNKAAAKIIQVLDSYLGLSVDYKPLLQKAVEVEDKLKTIVGNTKSTYDLQQKKKLNYFG